MYSNKLQAERENISSSPSCSLATNNPVKYLFQRSNKKRLQSKKGNTETVSRMFILKIFQEWRNFSHAIVLQVLTLGNEEFCKHTGMRVHHEPENKGEWFWKTCLKKVLISEGNAKPNSVFTYLP